MKLKIFFTTIILSLVIPILYSQSASAQTINNLVSNGDFENGTTGWSGISASNIVTTDSHSVTHSLNVTTQNAQRSVSGITPNQPYKLTAWVKWTSFTSGSWGTDLIRVGDSGSQDIGSTSIHDKFPQNQWTKVAIPFTTTKTSVNLEFGMWGSGLSGNIYFDDVVLFKQTTNIVPTISISSNVATQQAGDLNNPIQFSATGDDPDGAITVYDWDFGDGTTSRIPNPTHSYSARGTYNAKLTVYDENASSSVSNGIPITVTDTNSPTVTISSPTSQSTYTTTSTTISLQGTAQVGSASTIQSVVWDNVSTDTAGLITITAGSMLNWPSTTVSLKPGTNDILITATDNLGKSATDRIIVTRTISQPEINNVVGHISSVAMYDKYELTFDIDTVADNYFYHYDTSPPSGVKPGMGVTVEAIITEPSQTYTQPAFYTTDTQISGSGTNTYFEELGTKKWHLRFTPQAQGTHNVQLKVTDASGVTTKTVGTFTATAPTKKGFIKVSASDTRYFEYSNGEIFWPLGPTQGNLTNSGLNFDRQWMAGSSAYSTNFTHWLSSFEQGGNEGFKDHFSFIERYPGSELSYDLSYPTGYRIWIAGWGDEQFYGRLEANTKYLVKFRYKTIGVQGPRNASYPYGLAIRTSGYLAPSGPDDADNKLRNAPKVINDIPTNNDWSTLVREWQTGSSVSDQNSFNIYLDNVTAGQAYIDELSVRKINSDGSLGKEMIHQRKADKYSYVDARSAAYFDKQLQDGEQTGVFYKYVVHDKNDWIQNHLSKLGFFVDSGDGYYQPNNTRAVWLLEQWYRYLAARWGYSTAVHSWELNNEGSPEDLNHYRTTQEFAHYMHTIDAHPHLATTSFWCCWRPNFWGDNVKYPDVDYADIHAYGRNLDDGSYATDANYNFVDLIYNQSMYLYNNGYPSGKKGVGKPIIIGELGINPEDAAFTTLQVTNSGIWYHNLLWSQLNQGAAFPTGYWWSEHLSKIKMATISKPFGDFVKTLDFNRGGYADGQATATDTNMRIIGQKHSSLNRAVLWIQNKNHTWKNIMDSPNGNYNLSGTISVTLKPSTSYPVVWTNTYDGTVAKSENITSNASGVLTLNLSGLPSNTISSGDVAVKIGDFSSIPTPTSQPPSPTPTPLPRPCPLFGDTNSCDGLVNALDFTFLSNNFGTSTPKADLNNDGSVNALDFTILSNNFGKSM